MTREKSIEEIIKDEANDYAEKIAFRVPYDGSNNFYDDKAFEDSKRDYLAGRSKGIESENAKEERIKELEEENADLKRQLEKYETDRYDDDSDGRPMYNF